MEKQSNTLQAIWVSLGYLGTFLVALGSAMVLSRYLSKEEYGTYRQIIYIYTMLSGVFSAGLPSAYSYFLPKLNLSQGKQLSNILLFLFMILGSILSLVLYYGASILSNILQNPTLTNNLKLFSIIPILLIPTLGIEGLFTAVRKAEKLLIYNATTKLFMFICLIFPVMIEEANITMVIYGWIISSVFSLMLALYFKNLPFKDVKTEKLPFEIINLFKYTIPIMLTSYITVIQKSADQFFISRFYGEVSFAEYSNGFFEIPFVGMIVGSVSAVMIPIFSGAGSDTSKLKNAVISWRNALEKSIYLLYPMLCFCFVVSNQLIILIYGEQYAASITYFRMSLFLNFFNIILINSIIIALGKTKFYLIYNIICAAIIWITKFGTVVLFESPYYIALASVLNSIILIVIPFIYINKLLKIQLISKELFLRIIKIITSSMMCGIASTIFSDLLFPHFPIILSLLVKGIFFLVFFTTLLKVTGNIYLYSFIKATIKR